MSASPATLVCAVNWLGDGCMALPALARYRAAHPGERIVVLAKPKQHAFWRLVPSVDAVLPLTPGLGGLLAVRHALAAEPCARAIVLPNSWRAALAPWLARVPERIGARRGLRGLLLTRRVDAPAMHDPGAHQQLEYEALFGNAPDAPAPPGPLLAIPPAAQVAAERLLPEGAAPWVGLLPGAARGPSKQWPVERFAEVAHQLRVTDGVRVCLLGTGREASLCARIAGATGDALNLAGRTPLAELAAILARCACVLSNDSGGMHLAAVCGTPVAAIFGLTDPAKTGPVGSGHRILMAPGYTRGRDIGRRSAAAAEALAAVPAEAALEAVRALLGRRVEVA